MEVGVYTLHTTVTQWLSGMLSLLQTSEWLSNSSLIPRLQMPRKMDTRLIRQRTLWTFMPSQ